MGDKYKPDMQEIKEEESYIESERKIEKKEADASTLVETKVKKKKEKKKEQEARNLKKVIPSDPDKSAQNSKRSPEEVKRIDD